ncbi:Inosine-uridine preferring nucleoside hydrolase [Bacillus cereus Rock4-18]|nr:Inosine-uridine preferring nucleoside hydrolase [Bacillus cereus Rock4-18]
MNYKEKEFTLDLKEKIVNIEQKLRNVSVQLLQNYAPLFIKKDIELFIELEKSKKDTFEIGYKSSILLGVTDAQGDMIDFYTIPIWECNRHFFGIPVSINLPGSKVIGELIDESEKDIQIELRKHLEEFLELPD